MNRALQVFDDILQTLPGIDNPTPLVRLNRVGSTGAFPLWAKLEWFNPFGSVKDRAASYMIRELEKQGVLSSTRGVVEPTSGNTGLSLASICAAHGYPMRAIVPNKIPLEKKVLLKIAGAYLDVVNDELCPSPGGGDGSINMAKTYAKAQADRWVLPNQYENEANVLAHYHGTGPEIWSQTEGRVTHLFVSLGTCGTVTGCSRFLKERNPKVKVVAVQPTEGHDVPGLRNLSQLEVSKLFDPKLIDDILEIDFEQAYHRAVELARKEGLLAGPSSGLILEGARKIVERDVHGVGVLIFPDNVFKYVTNMSKHLPELLEGTSA